MINRSLILAGILAFCSGTASAQEIAGSWTASVDTPQGPFALAFEFMVTEGTKLVGSMVNELMGELPISEGEIDGNELSFKMLIEGGPGGTIEVAFKGKVEGDELTLTSTVEGAPAGGGPTEQTFVAKRAE